MTRDESRAIAVREKSTRIISSLRYETMIDRREAIVSAYDGTLEWMFDESRSPFPRWLKEGHGLFWVSGKAGSGKSTLMKRVAEHPELATLSEIWAGLNAQVLQADFYFWFAGSPFQKSVKGLYQSVLYQILRACPELVQMVCLRRWKSPSVEVEDQEMWSEDELKQCLEILASHSLCGNVGGGSSRQQDLRFLFFIDGLDEFDGNHRQLLRILQRLGSGDNIKICVSSRPWNDFLQLDLPSSSIRLEDLTEEDIHTYVFDTLHELQRDIVGLGFGEHPSDEFDFLVNTIVSKAHGVFLWGFLVIRSVCDGLANGDSIAILQSRVDELPEDLIEYFKLMFKRISPTYRGLATQLLRL
ncbi:hypothetical protein K431DRAFT_218899, partial [Polychaeton citri CBS 116435]